MGTRRLLDSAVSYQAADDVVVETTLESVVADRVVRGVPVRRVRSHARRRNYCGFPPHWATYRQPATLPSVPTDERLSSAVDQGTVGLTVFLA